MNELDSLEAGSGTVQRQSSAPAICVRAAGSCGLATVAGLGIARNSKSITIAAIAFSALLGIALSVRSGSVLHYYDERDYVRLAENLAVHHIYSFDGVHPTSLRAPGYSFLLSLPIGLGWGNLGLRLFNVALFIVSEWILVSLARRLFSSQAAAIAIALVLFYPVLIYTSTLLVPQTMGTAILLFSLWLLVGIREPAKWRIALSGLGFAILILTIPTFLFIAMALFAWLFWNDRRFRRRSPLFLFSLVLVLGWWTARNFAVYHSVFFIASNGGQNLLFGNSENSTMNSGEYTDISRYTAATLGMSQIEGDRYYKEVAKKWVEQHPSAAIRLYFEKLVQYFSFTERLATTKFATQAEQPFWRTIIMLLTYEPLLLVFLARIALSRKWPLSDAEKLFVVLYFTSAFTSAIFVPRIRYRLPMDWLLLLVDANMIFLWLQNFWPMRHEADLLA
jgi:4-amino-4-deoxy-L-arabinose transferase-like glycosyltransferase